MRNRVVDFTMPFMVDHLAALTKKRFNFQYLDDLAKHSTVKYGVLAGGSTEAFFQSSRVAVYAKMWTEMSRDGNASRVRTTQEGIERVMASTDESPWAFLSDSSSFSYVAGQQCELQVIKARFATRYLSLAVQLGSQYLDRLTLAVLEMLENGQLYQLRSKWWYERSRCALSADAFSVHCAKLRALYLSALMLVIRLLQ